jgi:hypothetical protein
MSDYGAGRPGGGTRIPNHPIARNATGIPPHYPLCRFAEPCFNDASFGRRVLP